MKDVRDSNPGAAATREVLRKQFIARSLDEIDQMRRCVPQLIKGDAATWQEVRFGAQRLAATATSLELGVLAACAQELASLTVERFAGAQLNEHPLAGHPEPIVAGPARCGCQIPACVSPELQDLEVRIDEHARPGVLGQNEPLGFTHPELLKIKFGPNHDKAIINGISRIGYMTGGVAAQWKDEDIADTLAQRSVAFLGKQKAGTPFFLFLATHDIHEPMVPHPRFRGTSGCGWRGDVIHQLDWTVGEVLGALDRLGFAREL